MKKIYILLVALGLTLGLPVNANTQIEVSDITPVSIIDSQRVTQEEKEDASLYNFPLSTDIAGTNLEKQRNNWLKGDSNSGRSKKKLGFDKKGSYIGWGVSPIDADPKSIDFGQKRIMAFEKAFADAKGKFVRTKKQKIVTSIVRKFFNDDMDDDSIELKDGRINGIGKKLMALTEAKLDQALKDSGVDPKDIENSNISKKRILAENSLKKTINVRSVQSIPGIRILATFEDVNAVGVLIKQNRNYANLAKAISSGKLVDYPSKTDPIDDITNQLEQAFANNQDYISQYGVRIMIDDAGNRVLVSFGQWSPKVQRHDGKMRVNMAVTAAKKIAYNQALSYMSQFVRTSLVLEDKTLLNDNDKITNLERTNGSEGELEASSVGAKIDEVIKESSRWTPEGATEAITWTTNHPETGHLIIGNVLMWSPLTQEYVQQKPQHKLSNTFKKKQVRKINSKIRTSIDLDNDDF